MTSPCLLEPNETLLPICDDRQSAKPRPHIEDTPYAGKLRSLADVIEDIHLHLDNVTALRKINLDTWQTEDVSELCAEIYLDQHDSEITEVRDEDALPPFVAHSKAWSVMRDRLEAQAARVDTRFYSDSVRDQRRETV